MMGASMNAAEANWNIVKTATTVMIVEATMKTSTKAEAGNRSINNGSNDDISSSNDV